MPEIMVTSNNKIHGKKVCIDRVQDGSNCRVGDTGFVSGNLMQQNITDNVTAQGLGPSNMLNAGPRSFASDASVPSLPLVPQQSKFQRVVGNSRSMQDHVPGSVNPLGASPTGSDMVANYADNLISGTSILPKRENQDGQVSPLSNFNKRARPDVFQQQQFGPPVDGIQGSDLNWRNALMQQAMARGVPYANAGLQKYTQQALDGVLSQETGTSSLAMGQQGIRYGANDDRMDGSQLNPSKNDMQVVEMERNHLEPQQSHLQQRMSQAFMRPGFPHSPSWNNYGQQDSRKEDQLQKRKSLQSPRLSPGAVPQSPLSSKSGEFSSGSVGPHYGAVAANAALGPSHKENSAVTSVSPVIGASSLTSSANDSMQRLQAQLNAKRKSNSLPKTPAASGVGSPASVSNINIPPNANSPSVGTPPLADQSILERFSKLEMVMTRYLYNLHNFSMLLITW